MVDPKKLVKGFSAFRFKTLSEKWELINGLAIYERSRLTVVIIALKPLDHHNGCLVNLRNGEDFCVDGNATVLISGTDGDLREFINLNL